MTDLISKLFDIATNEEFSPEQRKQLMKVAFDDAGMMLWAQPDGTLRSEMVEVPKPASLNIDAALGKHLTRERLADGTLRFGLASQLPAD